MLKNIMVPLADAACDRDSLAAAIKLSQHCGAKVRAVEICDLPPPVDGAWELIPAQVAAAAEAAIRSRAQGRAENVRAHFAEVTPRLDVQVWESSLDSPATVAAVLAQTADLCVLPAWAGLAKPVPALKRLFNAVLFQSGTPVLLVPPRSKHPLPPRCVLVAWNASPQARRALTGALPLLQAAEEVHVVEIEPPREGVRAEPNLQDAMLDYLNQHRVQARLVKLGGKPQSASEQTIAHARKVGAQLLVMGGYGHSRLREWSLGGMTRDVLRGCTIPVLLAH